jgi:hypothetical protein
MIEPEIIPLSKKGEVAIMTFDLPAPAVSASLSEAQGRFFGGSKKNLDVLQEIGAFNFADNATMVNWGLSNQLPKVLLDALMQSPIGLPIVRMIEALVNGQNISYFYEVTDFDTDTIYKDYYKIIEIEKFIKENFSYDFRKKISFDFITSGNAFVEFIPSNTEKVQRLKALAPFQVRVGATKNFEIKNYVVADFNSYSIPNRYIGAFESDIHFLASEFDYKFDKPLILHHKNYAGYPYYGVPTYIGALSYMKILSMIPNYHIANLDKGTFIRWHVQVPKEKIESLANSFKNEKNTDGSPLNHEQRIQKAVQAYTDIYKTHLSGLENNGSIITTSYEPTVQGNGMMNGVVITPLKIDVGSNDYVQLFQNALMGGVIGFGIDPSLSGISLGSSQSSGSEKFYSAVFFQNSVAIPYEAVLIETIDLCAKINNWHEKYPYPKQSEGVVGELKFEVTRPSFARMAENKNGISTVK